MSAKIIAKVFNETVTNAQKLMSSIDSTARTILCLRDAAQDPTTAADLSSRTSEVLACLAAAKWVGEERGTVKLIECIPFFKERMDDVLQRTVKRVGTDANNVAEIEKQRRENDAASADWARRINEKVGWDTVNVVTVSVPLPAVLRPNAPEGKPEKGKGKKEKEKKESKKGKEKKGRKFDKNAKGRGESF